MKASLSIGIGLTSVLLLCGGCQTTPQQAAPAAQGQPGPAGQNGAQGQPGQQGQSPERQLHRFMGTRSGRKSQYARLLVNALDLARVPRPLDQVLAHV